MEFQTVRKGFSVLLYLLLLSHSLLTEGKRRMRRGSWNHSWLFRCLCGFAPFVFFGLLRVLGVLEVGS